MLLDDRSHCVSPQFALSNNGHVQFEYPAPGAASITKAITSTAHHADIKAD